MQKSRVSLFLLTCFDGCLTIYKIHNFDEEKLLRRHIFYTTANEPNPKNGVKMQQ